ncbi:MAG: S-layer homology domain-containing protein [Oscillospiraceae bacterium]|jgi:spore germination protein YaaH|nr:S-layer homology domain-containing protein [Oscillospiraceae bacterium]
MINTAKIRKYIVLALVLAVTLSFGAETARAFESLTYLYGGTTATYLKRMDKTGDCINIVSPDYYETTVTDGVGGIKYTKLPDPLLISAMHAKDIPVTPFVSNHWNSDQARAMLKYRTMSAKWLAASVAEYDLDGLDIDIQNINEADRSNFVEFIRILRENLPADKTLTVCVAPNPYNTNVGWQGGYDYAALSQYCDHIFMMTYDESYDGGSPGPVSGYKFIEDSIKYGLKYVPKNKLMMGIPFYGRYWTDGIKGAAWTINDIEWLVEQTNAKTWYDDKNECARATIVVGAKDNITSWGGKKIAAGTYDVWYENARSYEKKLKLLQKHELKGVGSWALGQEPSWVWSQYAGWILGMPFTDIAGIWSQSYIISLAEDGIISGFPDNTFRPENTMTRAEAAVILCRLAGITPDASNAVFADMKGHWAQGFVESARKFGLVGGATPTQFQPDRPITREEFAVLASSYINIDESFDMNETPFSDVSREYNDWSIAAIMKLYENDVITGFPDGTFGPKRTLTRGEAATMASHIRELPARIVGGVEIAKKNRVKMGPR